MKSKEMSLQSPTQADTAAFHVAFQIQKLILYKNLWPACLLFVEARNLQLQNLCVIKAHNAFKALRL